MTITFSDTSYIKVYRDAHLISECANVTSEQTKIAIELFKLTEKQNEANSRTT